MSSVKRTWCRRLYLQRSSMSPWGSTSHLIDLQAVSTQGANQALIRHHWLVDDGSDSGSHVHGLTERRRLIAQSRPPCPQINLRKWHKSREVFPSFLSLSAQSFFFKKKERQCVCVCVCYLNYCLLPNLWIRPPVPPIGPQIMCWSSHTHWSSTFMRENKTLVWETVNEL